MHTTVYNLVPNIRHNICFHVPENVSYNDFIETIVSEISEIRSRFHVTYDHYNCEYGDPPMAICEFSKYSDYLLKIDKWKCINVDFFCYTKSTKSLNNKKFCNNDHLENIKDIKQFIKNCLEETDKDGYNCVFILKSLNRSALNVDSNFGIHSDEIVLGHDDEDCQESFSFEKLEKDLNNHLPSFSNDAVIGDNELSFSDGISKNDIVEIITQIDAFKKGVFKKIKRHHIDYSVYTRDWLNMALKGKCEVRNQS